MISMMAINLYCAIDYQTLGFFYHQEDFGSFKPHPSTKLLLRVTLSYREDCAQSSSWAAWGWWRHLTQNLHYIPDGLLFEPYRSFQLFVSLLSFLYK